MRVRNVRWVVIATIGLLVLIGNAGAGIQGQTASWADQDIGNPAIAGSAISTASGLTITAGGSDIWGASDQFHFVYQPVVGDVDVRARVDSMTYSSPWAKAGVMIRGSLAPNAAYGFALVSPGRGTAFQSRTPAGASSTRTLGVNVVAPEWVRLVRRGNTVTSYTSPDGASWSLITSGTIQLEATAYIGLAVTSRNTSTATTAILSRISVTPLGLPGGQQAADVGSPTLAGSTSYANGTYQVHAGGADISGTSDQFHFVYQQASGDLDVRLRVDSTTLSSSGAKAGVMIRETLNAGSSHAYAMLSAGQGFAFHRRPVASGATVTGSGSAGVAPGWVRLTRSGTLFTAYESADGQNWIPIGSDSITMADAIYLGIAVTSQNTTTATDVVADTLTITQANQAPSATLTAPANQLPTATLTAPATGATFTAPASITLTATASDADGTVARVDFYNGSTLLGSDTTAPYAFTWSNVAAGTYALKATAVDNAGATGSSATATITVAGAANGLVSAYGLDGGTGTVVTDNSGNGRTGAMSGATWVAGRYGQALSLNGASSVVTISDVDLPGAFTVMGWMQTRSLYANTCGSFVMKAFDYGFEVCNGNLLARIGSGTGWSTSAQQALSAADLNVWKHLAMTYDGTTVRLYIDGVLVNSATGAHVSNNNALLFGRWTPASEYWDGLVDEVRLYSRTLSQAEVQTDMATPVSGGPVNQAPSATLTAPATGATFTAPASISLTATASDADGSVARVDFYNGTTLLGSDTTSPYAFTWSNVAAGTYALKATAVDNAGASGSSSVASVTVTGVNQPPTVSITSPANNATFSAPASIAITANAADPENQLTRVEFFNGTTLLGTDTAAPYSFTWSSVPVGSYSLTARAYDAGGSSTTSAAVSVTVNATTGSPTGVIFGASADHATVTSYRLDVFAAGADVNTATPVATMNAGKPVPDVNNDITVSAPSFFSALAPGTYQLTLSAINSAGVGRSVPLPFTR